MSESLSGFDLRFENVRELVSEDDSIEVVINDDGATRVGKVEEVCDNHLELDGSAKLRGSSLSVIYEAETGFGFEAREVSVL